MHELVVFLLLLLLGKQSWAEQAAFSANEFEMILEGEDDLLIDLQFYVEAMEHKLHMIRRFAIRDKAPPLRIFILTSTVPFQVCAGFRRTLAGGTA